MISVEVSPSVVIAGVIRKKCFSNISCIIMYMRLAEFVFMRVRARTVTLRFLAKF